VSRLGRLAELDGRRVVVDVPATAANLGAGYDCVGLALDLTDRVELEALARPDAGIELKVEGEGADELPADRSNRLVRALDAALAAAWDGDPAVLGWRIRMTNRIPLARGLGSSAAATIAGVVAADALTGGPLDRRRMLEIAVGIEGHPDNAAPALLGGFTVSGFVVGPDGTRRVEAIRFDVPAPLRAVLFIPDLPMATSAMRAALPETVPHADAVHNIAAVGLGVAGIAAGRYDLLRAVPCVRLPPAAGARRGGPGGGSDRGVPVRGRQHDPRVRGRPAHGGPRRGGAPGTGGDAGPRRAGPCRGAAGCGCAGGRADLTGPAAGPCATPGGRGLRPCLRPEPPAVRARDPAPDPAGPVSPRRRSRAPGATRPRRPLRTPRASGRRTSVARPRT
jgi:homoserine kinase